MKLARLPISNDVKTPSSQTALSINQIIFQLIVSKAAEHFGVRVSNRDLFREVYAYYTRVYAGPDGNMSTAFYVSAIEEEPVLNGVTIPKSSGYVVRKEVEIDLSMCSVPQFRGILGKNFIFVIGFWSFKFSDLNLF